MKSLILVGPTRTGTTSLFRMLSNHPDILASRVKETNFFIERYNEVLTEDLYVGECFSVNDNSRVLMESSPLYFAFGEKLANKIKTSLADVYVLITVREPSSRFLSVVEHIHNKRNIGQDVDCGEIIDKRIDGSYPDVVSLDVVNEFIVREGAYGEVVKEWVDVFGVDRVRALSYEDVFSDVETFNASMMEVFKWLGIDESVDIPYLHENIGREVKYSGVHSFALKVNDFLEPLLNRFAFVRDFLRNIYYFFNEKNAVEGQYVDVKRIDKLKNYYGKVNSGFSQVMNVIGIGRSPGWFD